MDNIVKAARNLGLLIQKDERYQKFQEARKNYEADKDLQDLLKELDEKQEKFDKDATEEEFHENEELKDLCHKVFSNENMAEFQETNEIFSSLMENVLFILEASSHGEDPEAVDFEKSEKIGECAGSCSGCSGCH